MREDKLVVVVVVVAADIIGLGDDDFGVALNWLKNETFAFTLFSFFQAKMGITTK